MKHTEMKEKVKEEYFRHVRKILKTKLNGGNIAKGINTCTIFCSILGLELEEMDRMLNVKAGDSA